MARDFVAAVRAIAWYGALLVAGYLLMIYNIALGVVWLGRLQGNDFGKFYAAAAMWNHGHSLYAPTAETHMLAGKEYVEFLNMNPPHFHLLILPFLRFEIRTAALVWAAANVVAALVSGAIVFRELRLVFRASAIVPTVIFVLACGATGATILTGQYTGFLLLVMTLAWRAGRRHDWIGIGTWIGLAISLKPFLAVFIIYLMIERQWRAIVRVAAVNGGLFVIGLIVFGPAETLEWLKAVAGVDWSWAGMNGSLRGLFTRAFTEYT